MRRVMRQLESWVPTPSSPVRPPGPAGHPLLGILPNFANDPLQALESCVAVYGDISYMRLGMMGMYLLNHPSMLEEVLLTQQSKFTKDAATRSLRFNLGDGLLTSEGETWKRQRKLIAPTMKRRQIENYATSMVDGALRQVAKMQEGTRDIHMDMMALALDIASETMFGAAVAPEDGQRVGEVVEVVMEAFIRDARSWRRILPQWVPTRGRIQSQHAIKQVDHILYDRIRQSRAEGAPGEHLLAVLLQAKHEDGAPMTDREVRDEAVTMFVAGHETTALVLSYALYVLGERPDIVSWLEEEVDQVLGKERAEAADMMRLPRISAMVHETMRLYPPAWVIGREALEDCEVGGYTVQKGEQVLMSQWLLHRDARWFEAPLEFTPQRWEDGTLLKSLPRFVYFPFGGGSRTCIGNHFAKMEAVLVLATLVQHLRMHKVKDFTLEMHPSITMRPVKGVRLEVERR